LIPPVYLSIVSRLFPCFWVLLVLLLGFGEQGLGALRLEAVAGGSDAAHESNTRFSLANARGDVTTQVDVTGNVTWQASYEAFGTRTREKGLNWDAQRANSKDEDPTGLLNEGFRYRDLEAGVFISRDPAGFVDGPNVYCYVVQNPWSAFDPTGLSGKFLLKLFAKTGRSAVRYGDDGVAIIGDRTAVSYLNTHVREYVGKTYTHKVNGRDYDVKIKPSGFIDFSKWRHKGIHVEIDMVGDWKKDFDAADIKAGINPDYRKAHGLTWHHNEDLKTMELLPSELQSPGMGGLLHVGGAKIIEQAKKEGLLSMGMAIVAPSTASLAELCRKEGRPPTPHERATAAAKDGFELLDPGLGIVYRYTFGAAENAIDSAGKNIEDAAKKATGNEGMSREEWEQEKADSLQWWKELKQIEKQEEAKREADRIANGQKK
jgi:RHS repeat-associated protein